MKYIFVINPTAGKGTEQQGIIDGVKKYFEKNGGDFEIHITTAPGDAESYAKSVAQKGEAVRIYACGGEGTVFEVLNGVVGFDNVELGVVPCGSANDFLKFFKTRKPFTDIADQISGDAVPTDIIKAGDKYCLNGCSVGMDAMVARDMIIFKNWKGVSGAFAYKLAVLKTFLQKLGVEINLSVNDEKPETKRCLFAVIANAPYYGGGYMSAPDAVPFDGELDFTLVDVISKLRVPKFLSFYGKGEHASLDYCHLKRCESMEFTSDTPIPVNLDGEIVVTDHLKFSLVKSGVKFAIPASLQQNLLKK